MEWDGGEVDSTGSIEGCCGRFRHEGGAGTVSGALAESLIGEPGPRPKVP